MSTADVVPFYSCARAVRRDWLRLADRLRQVVDRGHFTAGSAVRELESAIERYTGARFAVACNSGSDALIFVLRAAGIGPGDEVIVPAYTFFASASAVLHVGAEPVLVDVLPGSYAIDPQAAADAITARTRAIMPVHLFSQMADMLAVGELAERHGLTVLEDSAEGIGMRIADRHAGRWGRAGVLSFFPTKTLGGFGDGGMVLTDDEALAGRVRLLLRHGQREDGSGVHEVLGYNSRLDEVQACVLLTRLERLDEEIARRAALAGRYTAGLADLAPRVRTPRLAPSRMPSSQVWYVYLVECDRRDELAAFLAGHGIHTEVYYPRPLTEQPCLSARPGAARPVPVARAAAGRALALPLYPDLTDREVDRVVEVVRRFYREGR